MKNYNDHRKFYYNSGNVESESYYLNSKFHRTDGPAFIYYYENGSIWEEIYCLNDNWHRTDGPAYITYDDNGNITLEDYCLNNELINVNSLEEFKRYQKVLILK